MQSSAFDIESIEQKENVILAFDHSQYNHLSVVFDTGNITSDMINEVNGNCNEMLHIYEINSNGERTRVSFEF